MCGIIGLIVKKKYEDSDNLAITLYNLFRQQSTRGTQGFGIAYLNQNKEIKRIRSETITDIFGVWNKDSFEEMNNTGTYILFHHRVPTCNQNKEKYNHPFLNEKQDIALIHNGYLYNDKELYKELKEKGHNFETENEETKEITDSEVMLHLYEEKPTSSIKEKIQELENKTLGQLSIIIIDNQKNKLIAYKRNQPLVISKNDNLLILTSEYHEELKQIGIKELREMKENELLTIDAKGNYVIDLITKNPKVYSYKSKGFDYKDYWNDNKSSVQTSIIEKFEDEKDKERAIIRLEKRIKNLEKQKESIIKKLNKKNKNSKEIQTALTAKESRRIKELAKLIQKINASKKILQQYLNPIQICEWCGEKTQTYYIEKEDVHICKECIDEYTTYIEEKEAIAEENKTENILERWA